MPGRMKKLRRIYQALFWSTQISEGFRIGFVLYTQCESDAIAPPAIVVEVIFIGHQQNCGHTGMHVVRLYRRLRKLFSCSKL